MNCGCTAWWVSVGTRFWERHVREFAIRIIRCHELAPKSRDRKYESGSKVIVKASFEYKCPR
jgi:hypothetical protein